MTAEAAPPDLYAHRGTRAVQRLVEFAPSTGGLALWVQHHDLPADDAAEAATGVAPLLTDGHRLHYRAAFTDLPLPLQTGWVAHAVLHVALRHPQRARALQQLQGEVDLQLFNLCADAIVNSTLAHLGWLTLPRGALLLEALLAQALGVEQTPEGALLQWDVERLYRAVDDRRPAGTPSRAQADDGAARQRSGQAQAGQRGGAGQAAAQDGGAQSPSARSRPEPAAEHRADGRPGAAAPPDAPAGPAPQLDGPRAARTRMLGAGQPPDLLVHTHSPDPPEAEAQAAREWFERLLRAHANDGAFSMLRVLLADMPKSRTPWTQVLRQQAARALAPKPALSWSRPSRSWLANQGRMGPGRRMPWEPGRSGSQPVPRLVLVVDVSGSIEDQLMQQFAREIEALTRRLGARLVLVIGDERVRTVQHFGPGDSALRDIVFEGGGGTDFRPLLAEALQHRPDLVIVLTDLDGPAGEAPRVPVLWAVPEDQAEVQPPFGRKLVLA